MLSFPHPPAPDINKWQIGSLILKRWMKQKTQSHIIYIPLHSTLEISITRLMLSMLCFSDEEKRQDKYIQQLNIFLRERKNLSERRLPPLTRVHKSYQHIYPLQVAPWQGQRGLEYPMDFIKVNFRSKKLATMHSDLT